MKTTRQMWGWYKPHRKLTLTAVLLLLTGLSFAQEKLPFTKGVNLTNYFESWDGRYEGDLWQGLMPNLNKYDEYDFACFKDIGIDVIRLVCSFDIFTDEPGMTGNANNGKGKIDELVLEKLDQVCDWAEKYQIYLIIDNHINHTFGAEPKASDTKMLRAQLESVWNQLAPRYKDRSEYIIYEIMNEPAHKDAKVWYKLQQDIINLIRSYDQKHAIVVSPSDCSNLEELVKLKPYKDPNLIYTFHFYEPLVFSHQGTGIASEGSLNLSDLTFPYDKNRLPKYQGQTVKSWEDLLKKEEETGTWFYWSLQTYPKDGTVKNINDKIKKAAAWAKKNKVRLMAGEIGSKVWSIRESRLAWINTVVSAMNENQIPYCNWGVGDSNGFLKELRPGLFEEAIKGQLFPEDIDQEVLEALGFSMPSAAVVEKTNSSLKDPNLPFVVYEGLTGKGVYIEYDGAAKETIVGDEHKNCVVVSLQTKSGLRYILPKLVTEKLKKYKDSMYLCLSVKFTEANQQIEIQFEDNDGGKQLPPWKKSCYVKAGKDSVGKWKTYEIPLSSTVETGAWSNISMEWYNPRGEFDWNRCSDIFFDINKQELHGDVYIDDIVLKIK